MGDDHDQIAEEIYAYLDQRICAQAAGALMVRQQQSIEDATDYLERVARELGVKKVDLAYVVTQSLGKGLTN